MQELIKVTTTAQGGEVVSARDLHTFFESAERFSKWFDRMKDYGLIENKDFSSVLFGTHQNQYGGEKDLQDYCLTIDCAKHISMLQRTEKGKQARQYFIDRDNELKALKTQNNLELYNILNTLTYHVADLTNNQQMMSSIIKDLQESQKYKTPKKLKFKKDNLIYSELLRKDIHLFISYINSGNAVRNLEKLATALRADTDLEQAFMTIVKGKLNKNIELYFDSIFKPLGCFVICEISKDELLKGLLKLSKFKNTTEAYVLLRESLILYFLKNIHCTTLRFSKNLFPYYSNGKNHYIKISEIMLIYKM